jgi:Glycosyl transferase family 2
MSTAAAAALPIAVIIAAYNRARWVGGAVESALRQWPLPPAEGIVVDDGSTDQTADVAERGGARVIRHTENKGAAAARNTGVAATTQPWIAPLDSDDRWLPHMLSTLWPLRKGYGFVSGASMAVDEAGSPIAYGGPMDPHPILFWSPAPLVFPENFIAASGVIMRRKTFVKTNATWHPSAARRTLTSGFGCCRGGRDCASRVWLRVTPSLPSKKDDIREGRRSMSWRDIATSRGTRLNSPSNARPWWRGTNCGRRSGRGALVKPLHGGAGSSRTDRGSERSGSRRCAVGRGAFERWGGRRSPVTTEPGRQEARSRARSGRLSAAARPGGAASAGPQSRLPAGCGRVERIP